MSIEKHFVFDDDGKLKEVRGYRDDIVSERWGIVYDESERVVGLRPLSVKEVIPQSILDKIKFWRKPKPLTQILSIDFIGLIQYIGLINKINKIKNIELIDEITTIKNIEHATVDTLTTIREVTHRPLEVIVNSFAQQDFTGWYHSNVVIDSTKSVHEDKCWKFPADADCTLSQSLPVPIGVDWFEELYVWIQATSAGVDCLRVIYKYSDGTQTPQTNLQVSSANVWERKVLSPIAGKKITMIVFDHPGYFTMDTVLDSIFVVF